MQVIRGLREGGLPERPVVTIGNFDGVHLGHQRLLGALVDAARERDTASLVVTFDPHPLTVVAPDRGVSLLVTHAARLRAFERLGVDAALVLPFTRNLAATDSDTFVRDILVDRLGAQHVLVGPDTRFGRNRGGDWEEINTLGAELGFTAERISPVRLDGGMVSSTAIRNALNEGDVALAGRMLGRHHRISGEVVRGQRRARAFGYPTANLRPDGGLIPKNGVYAARVRTPDAGSGVLQDAVVNVGVKPTFGGKERTIEAHILGFAGDLYGKHIGLDFIERIRGERTFRGADELAEQIALDIDEATRVFERRG